MSKPKTLRQRAEAAVAGTVPPGTSAFRERVDLYMRAYRAGSRKGPTEKELLARLEEEFVIREDLKNAIRSCFARSK